MSEVVNTGQPKVNLSTLGTLGVGYREWCEGRKQEVTQSRR